MNKLQYAVISIASNENEKTGNQGGQSVSCEANAQRLAKESSLARFHKVHWEIKLNLLTCMKLGQRQVEI